MEVIFKNINTTIFERNYYCFLNIPSRGDFVKIDGIYYEVIRVSRLGEDTIISCEYEVPKRVCVHIRKILPQKFYLGHPGVWIYKETMFVKYNTDICWLEKVETKRRAQALLKNN
jgi:hypothetical protein